MTHWSKRSPIDRSSLPPYATDSNSYIKNASGCRAFGSAAKTPLRVVDSSTPRSVNGSTTPINKSPLILRFPSPSGGEGSTVRQSDPLHKATPLVFPGEQFGVDAFDDSKHALEWPSVNMIQPTPLQGQSLDFDFRTGAAAPSSGILEPPDWKDVTDIMEMPDDEQAPSESPALSPTKVITNVRPRSPADASVPSTAVDDRPVKRQRILGGGSAVVKPTTGLRLLQVYGDNDSDDDDDSD